MDKIRNQIVGKIFHVHSKSLLNNFAKRCREYLLTKEIDMCVPGIIEYYGYVLEGKESEYPARYTNFLNNKIVVDYLDDNIEIYRYYKAIVDSLPDEIDEYNVDIDNSASCEARILRELYEDIYEKKCEVYPTLIQKYYEDKATIKDIVNDSGCSYDDVTELLEDRQDLMDVILGKKALRREIYTEATKSYNKIYIDKIFKNVIDGIVMLSDTPDKGTLNNLFSDIRNNSFINMMYVRELTKNIKKQESIIELIITNDIVCVKADKSSAIYHISKLNIGTDNNSNSTITSVF